MLLCKSNALSHHSLLIDWLLYFSTPLLNFYHIKLDFLSMHNNLINIYETFTRKVKNQKRLKVKGSLYYRPRLLSFYIVCLALILNFLFCDFRCGHCKKLAPEYEKAATALLNADPAVPIAKVRKCIAGLGMWSWL